MPSATLDGHGGWSACDEPGFEYLSAITSPTPGPDAKTFSMLQDVSGGCWVRICHHIPWNGIGSSEAESVDLDNAMTQDTDSETPEIMEECVSRDVGASTVHSTQRTHNAVSIEVGVSKRAVARGSHLRFIRRRPKAVASASQLGARLEMQHPGTTATSLTERVAPGNGPSLGNANSLYPQALSLPSCHSSITGSADRRSIAASSGLLSPWLMPNFHQAESRSAKGSATGSTNETSRSSSACSFDVDEIIDVQPRLDNQPGYEGSKRMEGKFREMWLKVQSRNVKRRGPTSLAKSTSWW